MGPTMLEASQVQAVAYNNLKLNLSLWANVGFAQGYTHYVGLYIIYTYTSPISMISCALG